MPFIRLNRDKRGYDTTYLLHGYRTSANGGRSRLLYLFRSPSQITIGRRPLDEEARTALEHTHPDVAFDWDAIGQDISGPRPPMPTRPWREGKPSKPSQPAAPPVVEDETVLGKTLGVVEAARLRARYLELTQRISRRARSPEERDQLMERARRLNPDDWRDAASVRAGVSTAEAEWETLVSALPHRRRGRRGGRRREEASDSTPTASSGIMAGEVDGDVDEGNTDAQMARTDGPAGDPGDDDRVGGPGTGDGLPGDD